MNKMARRMEGEIWKCGKSIAAVGRWGVRSIGTVSLISENQPGYCPSLCTMEISWDTCLIK
jgi:hypothetical protein